MVEALRLVGERQLHEIALVQEGQRQLRAGQGIPFARLLAELRADGILPDDEEMDRDADTDRASA